MQQSKNNLKPQDIVILLKIIALGEKPWFHHTIAQELGISQSEVSQSLNRSKYAGLTAHSAEPLNQIINSNEKYVWPYAKGSERGQAIEPLYSTVVEATSNDKELYELLTMVDAIRVGRIREKEIAKKELEKRILNT